LRRALEVALRVARLVHLDLDRDDRGLHPVDDVGERGGAGRSLLVSATAKDGAKAPVPTTAAPMATAATAPSRAARNGGGGETGRGRESWRLQAMGRGVEAFPGRSKATIALRA